ncbi:Transcriptional regulator PadR-like family protein [Candidatus Tiddalikarchaeum anstoanum]|nr:Transcriptional regulator PadR-like family protein [Candidatus Tiddalikarchaeum anstoanum]
MVDVLRGNLKFLVLHILSAGPIHGYGLFKELEKSYKWRPSCGTLYPVLNTLEKDSLITSSETVECGRFKKIYSITPKGIEALNVMVKELRESLQQLNLN